jgi:hypothetical protein
MSSILTSYELGNAQIAALLDRVSRLYPGGIPTAALRSAQKVSTVKALRCAIIAVGVPETLDQGLSTLAQAICTKGLRLTLEDCAILGAPMESCSGEALEGLVAKIAAPVVILCGGTLAPGTVKEISGAVVLTSHALSEVAQVVETKRRFWEHLKLIIPRL